ncbi:hypothetical protein CN689_25280 [Peribacillus butanolivorans]|uniref:Uncharacterized protein n=1 Tax=Peribacillus butanolivorans TaxID=421767 RepID=A0AAX0RXZ8_9BACI|nr:hypothetical protein CN689_25280 [Peribacillus butanolivorans]
MTINQVYCKNTHFQDNGIIKSKKGWGFRSYVYFQDFKEVSFLKIIWGVFTIENTDQQFFGV